MPAAASDSPLGSPLLGALLRMPVDVIRGRMLAALHDAGFDDLVPAHLVVLRWPGPQGRRPSEIAAHSDMSKQAMNYLLGQLEALGYLERRADPSDQRGRLVHLTPRGAAAGATMRAAVEGVEREWAELIGAKDVERLRTLLRRLTTALGTTES